MSCSVPAWLIFVFSWSLSRRVFINEKKKKKAGVYIYTGQERPGRGVLFCSKGFIVYVINNNKLLINNEISKMFARPNGVPRVFFYFFNLLSIMTYIDRQQQ